MHANGISFGGHTINHVRLSEVDDNKAREEIAGSMETLKEQLGERSYSFAFPYGLKKDAKPEHEKMVAEAGFNCNCMAYYKRNKPGADLYKLGRILVTARMPRYMFKNICMGVPISAAIGYLGRKIIGR